MPRPLKHHLDALDMLNRGPVGVRAISGMVKSALFAKGWARLDGSRMTITDEGRKALYGTRDPSEQPGKSGLRRRQRRRARKNQREVPDAPGIATARDPADRAARVHQCKSCPWRVDCVPDRDIPNYRADLARGLTCTINSGLESAAPVLSGGPMRMMACHYSKPGEEFACAGWIYNQLGVGNNIGVRLLVMNGRMPVPEVDGEQHERYEDTLPCGDDE